MRLALLFVFSLMCASVGGDEPPVPHDSQDPGQGPTSPGAALQAWRLPDGFQATLFAAEPDVRQPIHISTDERGRLWVCENDTYAEQSVNFEMKYHDRIVILEDTDGDGRHDRRTVFWDQGQKLTSAVVGFGGVWALCAPQLLFIPDRDRDDRPDGPPQVILDGWNDDAVRHNIVNGLMWGPDGWLYGRHGILATSLVGPPGAADSQRTPINCGVWRFHPQTHRFEVVARGTTNPWGMDYDDDGEMLMINTVIGHLWHVVPGAYWKRMYGAHAEAHLYELIDQCADHYHWDTREDWFKAKEGLSDSTSQAGGGHAHCGLMIYLGDNWPAAYRNGVFTLNLHGRRINHDRLESQGAGLVGRHEPDFAFSDDTWFRGIELVYGPDGGVYVADWSDIGECHENDGVHRSTGRIFKITYQGTPQPPAFRRLDLAKLSDAELVGLQMHANDWYVRQARRILQERAAIALGSLDDAQQAASEPLALSTQHPLRSAAAQLRAMFAEHPEVRVRLRAMWCLYAIGQAPPQWLVQQLTDPEPRIRAWAVRLLTDDAPEAVAQQVDALVELAEHESSGRVRLYLASALQRLPLEQRWPLAEAMGEDSSAASEDPLLTLMTWYGLEPAVVDAPSRALKLAGSVSSGKLSRFLARRVTTMHAAAEQPADDIVEAVAQADSQQRRQDLLQGMTDGLKGRRQAPRPQGWTGLVERLEIGDGEETHRLLEELSVVFGDGRALEQVRHLAFEASSDPAARMDALQTYARTRPDDLLEVLKQAIDDRVLRETAIAGLAACDAPEVAQLILDRYQQLSLAGRSTALDTLCARSSWASALLAAVRDRVVPREDVSAWHARQMVNLGDPQVTAQLRRAWGEIREASQDRKDLMLHLEQELTQTRLAEANRERGRELFRKTCANCHVLYGEGGRIGPDLTGANRANLRYLLENIVDPSASVIADFRASIVRLQDGRVLTGVVLNRSDGQVLLQTKDRQETLLESEIEEIQPTNASLMPDGLLTTLDEDAIRDLLGYIMPRRN